MIVLKNTNSSPKYILSNELKNKQLITEENIKISLVLEAGEFLEKEGIIKGFSYDRTDKDKREIHNHFYFDSEINNNTLNSLFGEYVRNTKIDNNKIQKLKEEIMKNREIETSGIIDRAGKSFRISKETEELLRNNINNFKYISKNKDGLTTYKTFEENIGLSKTDKPLNVLNNDGVKSLNGVYDFEFNFNKDISEDITEEQIKKSLESALGRYNLDTSLLDIKTEVKENNLRISFNNLLKDKNTNEFFMISKKNIKDNLEVFLKELANNSNIPIITSTNGLRFYSEEIFNSMIEEQQTKELEEENKKGRAELEKLRIENEREKILKETEELKEVKTEDKIEVKEDKIEVKTTNNNLDNKIYENIKAEVLNSDLKLEEQIEKIKTDKEKLEGVKDIIGEEIFNSKIEELNNREIVLNDIKENLDREKELEKQLEELKKSNKELEINVDNLAEDKIKLEDKVETLTTEKTELETNLKTTNENLETLTTEKESLEINLKTANENLELLTTEKETLKEKVETLTTEKETLRKEFNLVNEELLKVANEKLEITKDRDIKGNLLEEQIGKVKELTEKNYSLNSDNGDLNRVNISIKNDNESLEKVKNSLYKENQDLKEELKGFNGLKKSNEELQKEFKEYFEKTENDKKDFGNYFKDNEAEKSNYKKEIEELKKELEKLKDNSNDRSVKNSTPTYKQ